MSCRFVCKTGNNVPGCALTPTRVSLVFLCITETFLGNQMLSYGQNLSLSFRVDRRDTRLSAEDLVLEGADLRVAVPLIAQGNAYPNENMQTYVFR